MALCRIKTVEQLQYESPGELGRLMGLDRVPEVRCLRHVPKIRFENCELSDTDRAKIKAALPNSEQSQP